MRRLRRYILSALIAGSLLAAGAAGAQDRPSPDLPVEFTADSVTDDRDLGVITASGNVEITQGSRILLADTVSFNRKDNILAASGNVSLLEPSGEVLFAELMELTGDLRDGIIKNLRIRLSDNARIAAAGARRSNGVRTEMANAVYSPCDSCATEPGEPPLWQVKARRVIHDQVDKTISYRDAFFEFKGVPMAYTPYFSHPDPTVKRKTGFITPSVGGSSFLGTNVTTPYFINLAPNRDITITPTITTKERAVLAGEYRHLLPNGRLLNSASITLDSQNSLRGHLDSETRFDLNDIWRTGLDIKRASDDTYLRRYSISSVGTLRSRMYAEGFKGRDYALVDSYLFQGLRAEDDAGTTPIVAPSFEFSHIGEPNRIGAFSKLDASLLALTRTEGSDTRRASMGARWQVPYFGPLGEVISLSAGLRGDLYSVTNLARPGIEGTDSGLEHRLYPEARAEWRLPLSRSHGQIIEQLEPAAAFTVSPNGGNSRDIPNEDSLDLEFDDTNLLSSSRFTGIDRVEGGARLAYGVKWGVAGPGGGSSEIFVGQSYRPREDDTFGENSGLEGNFSDYVARVQVQPVGDFSLSYRTRLDKDDLAPNRNELSLVAGPPSLRLNSSYVFFKSEQGSEFGGREELFGALTSQIDRFWRAGLSARYDLEGSSELRSFGLDLTYECECFIFSMAFRRQFFEDRDLKPSDSILFRLTFKTLGDVQTGLSRAGS